MALKFMLSFLISLRLGQEKKKKLETFARDGKVGNSNAIAECQSIHVSITDSLMVHLILQSN